MRFTDFQLTIDGVPMPEATAIDFTRGYSLERKAAEPPSLAFSATFTAKIDEDAFARLFGPRHPPGASETTLIRRVKYGGRKGRSALRRLLARAPAVVVSTSGVSIRGRAVFLSDSEIIFRASPS